MTSISPRSWLGPFALASCAPTCTAEARTETAAGCPTAASAPGTSARSSASPPSIETRSPSVAVTVPSKMLLSPMKDATCTFAGRFEIVKGSATCSMRPSCMTTIRSPTESASS